MSKISAQKKILYILMAMVLIYLAFGLAVAAWRVRMGSFESVIYLPASGTTASSTVTGKIDYEAGLAAAAARDAAAGNDGSGGNGDGNGDGKDNPFADTHFYRFTVATRVQRLHLREAPSLMAKIIDKNPKGTTGYVLFTEGDWSYIVTDAGRMGYSYNGYLALTEITPEEYPQEYMSLHR